MPASIVSLKLLDTAQGHLQIGTLPDAGFINLAELGAAAKTYTIAAETLGAAAVQFTLLQANGVVVQPPRWSWLVPLCLKGRGHPADLKVGEYVLKVTPFGSFDTGTYKGSLAGEMRQFNFAVTAGVTPDPPPPPIIPDTVMPTDVDSTSWDEWTGGVFRPLQGVRYVCNSGKSISGVTNRVIEPEPGPVPAVLDFSGAPTGAGLLAFTTTSQGFQCQGQPARVYLGSTDGGRCGAFLRGRQHRFSFWFWGGSDCYVGRDNGSADITIDGGGLLDEIHSCFCYVGGTTSTWHDRFRILNADLRQQSLWEHHIRMYRVRDGLIRDVRSKLSPLQKGSSSLRIHSCAGFRVEASAPDRCVFEGRFNKLGPLNQSAADPWFTDDLYIGPDVKFKGDVYLSWGTRNITFDRAVIEAGDYNPISVVKSYGAAKGPPTGRFIDVPISANNGTGSIVTGDGYAFIGEGCTITNPKRGWVDRPLNARLQPA